MPDQRHFPSLYSYSLSDWNGKSRGGMRRYLDGRERELGTGEEREGKRREKKGIVRGRGSSIIIYWF